MKWLSVALKELVILGPQYGANARAISPTGNQPRYVRITDIDSNGRLLPDGIVEADIEDFSAYHLEEGDLLFARSGATVGKTYLHQQINGPCIFAGYLIRFRPNKKLIVPRYLFYYTKSEAYHEWVANRKRTAAQPNINGTEYASLVIPLSPLPEQRRIVEILDQADALRKKRAETDAKAERILPALFYKMFGDPATNPKGWKIASLSNAGAEVRYGLGQPPEASSSGIPLIRATNIRRGKISKAEMLFVDPAAVPKTRNAFLSAEEVIVVRSGAYTGDVAQVTERWRGAVAGYDLVITPGEKFCGEYLEAYLLTPNIQKNYFNNLKARAGQPHLNASQLGAAPIPCPPKDLQLCFAERVQRIRYLREHWAISGRQLNDLFVVLMNRAFSGDLTAKWREAHTKELLAEMEEQAKMLRSSL